MRLAIIDLGTNTFNLLIVDTLNEQEYTVLFEQKLPVKLGKGGIHNKVIQADAMQRAESALAEHYETIRRFKAERVHAFGTSALRGAGNADDFLKKMREKFNFEIQLIDGNKEAELIYKGVRQTLNLGDKPSLILDIGGGSNEFIICNDQQIFWKKSFDLGIARLLEIFSPSDPVTKEELARVDAFFENELQPLFKESFNHNIKRLIGASGTFDTLMSMIDLNRKTKLPGTHSQKIEMHDFYNLYTQLLPSSHKQRSKMPGLEPMRIEMIVLAIHFVKFIIEKLQIEQLFQSDFSLKEGAIFEVL